MTRTRRGLPVAALFGALALAGCLTNPARTVSLQMRGNVADASVTIDDQYVGALGYVAAHGVALPPGKHRVTVEKAGFFPWDELIEASGAPIRLDVALVPIPD